MQIFIIHKNLFFSTRSNNNAAIIKFSGIYSPSANYNNNANNKIIKFSPAVERNCIPVEHARSVRQIAASTPLSVRRRTVPVRALFPLSSDPFVRSFVPSFSVRPSFARATHCTEHRRHCTALSTQR